jgi:quinol-cytochrome oxidoreductase complex cytochrome b subunit
LKLELDPKKTLAVVITALVLLFDASDEVHGRVNSYRLFLGLMIMIGFVGKSLWDVLAPQGLAKKVSNTRAIAIVALAIFVLGFIVFTVARALSFYLDSSIAADAANYLP